MLRRQWLAASALYLTASTLVRSHSGTLFGFQDSSEATSLSTLATGSNVVASVHPLATAAALTMYSKGGNAIDAAIAAALTLSVVDSHNSGIGGGCLAIIRTANGQIYALDGREMAPHLAHADMYLRNGKPDGNLSQNGPLAVATPGQISALYQLSTKAGHLAWNELFAPAITHAEEGFAIDRVLASRIKSEAELIRQYPETARILLKADGAPYELGETLRQPDLANTLRSLAQHGPDWFYLGPFAEMVGKWMTANGGILATDDFARYECKFREPLRTRYRDYQIIGMPPPSSGGIHVAQMLHMLQEYPLPELWRSKPAEAYHLMLEAMQLAFADRAHWLGDSDFVNVPKGLVDPVYGRELAGKMSRTSKSKVPAHNQPPQAERYFFDDRKHTTHLTTADNEGNWVAITSTINTSFGSKVIVPGTGVLLNNEMDDFSIAPGTPNAFGLVGSQANAVAPGKRPLSSMSPTLVLDANAQPVLSCGAAGGPKIITAVMRIVTATLDQGSPLDEAVAAPRVHHQWQPDETIVEERMPEVLKDELRKLGHPIRTIGASAIAQAIQRTADGKLHAASDPRVPSQAAAWNTPEPAPSAPK